MRFIEKIRENYCEYKKEEENLYLFGNQQDIQDCQRETISYSVVITDSDEIEYLKDAEFMKLLSNIDVKYSPS